MICSCCMDEISDADGAILAESCDNLPKTSPIIQNTPRKRPKNSPLKPDVLQSPRDPVREGYVATFQCRHFDIIKWNNNNNNNNAFSKKTQSFLSVIWLPMALGYDGRIQKLTVHTLANNEKRFKKFYRSLETLKSINFMHCWACAHRFPSLNIDLTVELHRHQRWNGSFRVS